MESQWKISDKRSPTGEELDQVAHVLSHMDSFRFDVGGISMRLLECPSNSSLLATRLATEVVTRVGVSIAAIAVGMFATPRAAGRSRSCLSSLPFTAFSVVVQDNEQTDLGRFVEAESHDRRHAQRLRDVDHLEHSDSTALDRWKGSRRTAVKGSAARWKAAERHAPHSFRWYGPLERPATSYESAIIELKDRIERICGRSWVDYLSHSGRPYQSPTYGCRSS